MSSNTLTFLPAPSNRAMLAAGKSMDAQQIEHHLDDLIDRIGSHRVDRRVPCQSFERLGQGVVQRPAIDSGRPLQDGPRQLPLHWVELPVGQPPAAPPTFSASSRRASMSR